MPFNGIAFHLHELCCLSPVMVRRMMAGGHGALALTTATEIAGMVEGMQPVLEALARESDPATAQAAARHLERHYRGTL